jgi:hypothetical protein
MESDILSKNTRKSEKAIKPFKQSAEGFARIKIIKIIENQYFLSPKSLNISDVLIENGRKFNN